MSPRAAWRLERLGYAPVYDYANGKVDWMAAGLPTVRDDTADSRALDAADRVPATCGPDDLVRDVAERNLRPPIIVVNEQHIVFGRFRPARAHGLQRVEDVMDPGPTTVRAHEPLFPLLARMSRHHIDAVIVTTPEGELLGVVHRGEIAP